MKGNTRIRVPATRIQVLCFVTSLAWACREPLLVERYFAELVGECFGSS